MTEPELTQPEEQSEPKERLAHSFRNLRELVDYVAGKSLPPLTPEEGLLTEALPFPFLAIVGQQEMKLALLLGLINPNIGGILLVGPRGTAKTTAVRSLLDLLPQVERSTCFYGCLPEDIEIGGIDAVCPECARKYGEGQPLTAPDRVRLIELPLNAKLEDVIGGIDERAALHERMRVKRASWRRPTVTFYISMRSTCWAMTSSIRSWMPPRRDPTPCGAGPSRRRTVRASS